MDLFRVFKSIMGLDGKAFERGEVEEKEVGQSWKVGGKELD